MTAIDELPVLYRDVAALEAERVSQPPELLLRDVHRAADAVGQGVPLSGEQLDGLREATRRLRRAIEVRAIVGSALCRSCGETYQRGTDEHRRCATGA